MASQLPDKLPPLSQLTIITLHPQPKASGCQGTPPTDPAQPAWDILQDAQNAYTGMDRFRRERDRCKRYLYGDQWSDLIEDDDGRTVTEGEMLRSQGQMPLVNNLIRRLVRSVIGAYRAQAIEPVCYARDRDEQAMGETMTTVLQCNLQLNQATAVQARTFEEFLMSGMAVHRHSYGWRMGREDVWTDYVQPNNFFIDGNMRDFRGWDVTLIGEVHDISFGQLCETFAPTPDQEQRLHQLYGMSHDRQALSQYWESFGYPVNRLSSSFLMASDQSRCRVIEVWRKECKPRYRVHDPLTGELYKIETEDYAAMVEAVNAERTAAALAQGLAPEETPLLDAQYMMDDRWVYYFLTPYGDILEQGESPYRHGGHPYTFRTYPFIDGELHSFVSDIIDQQRYVNRLVTMHDMIMRASAKGLLMVPDDCVPRDRDVNEWADTWHRFDGVIVYHPSASGHVPQQVSANSTNVGITELLQYQLKFFEDISGVQGVLQGRPGFSGMAASLYAQMSQNATTSLLDILSTYQEFCTDGARKVVSLIQQYYTVPRVFNIAGKGAARAYIDYDPAKVRDVDFDLSIVPSTATPIYRQMANEFLLQLFQSGQLPLEDILEAGDFPFADTLLQKLKARQEAQAQQPQPQQPAPQGLPQEAQQQPPQQ